MRRKIQCLMFFMVLSAIAAFGQQSNVQVTPYGYIKFDAIHDSSRTAFGEVGAWVMPETAIGGGERELTFSAREARLGLNLVAPETRGVKTTGRIEADFYEEIATPNKYAPRLRLAYVDLAWENGWSLRFGQDWDTYVSFHPDMVDASALAYQGHLYNRHPQVRVTKDVKLGENTTLTTKFAVQYGRNNEGLVPGGQSYENIASVPSFHGSFVLKPRLLTDRQSTFAISGMYGRESVRGVENTTAYESWLIHGGVQLPLSQRFTLQGIAWKGANLDNHFGGISQGIDVIKGTEVSTRGGWGQFVYTPTKNTRASVGYGIEDPVDDDLSGDARTRTDRIFTNFFYNATSNVTFGIEYALMRTDYAVSKNMENHRVNFAVFYRF